ncbi:hypothetical protein Hypma_009465 [Hypsizygus marmoreus]|uniref:Uncharacterized protein n=1 Tax=Hypsizygus marmoreus TaxID=39966 RepID=A0A369JYD5_HYPMA|nr:hypothetical protein Hypma_009465 [Hypsizygus marmoreus]
MASLIGRADQHETTHDHDRMAPRSPNDIVASVDSILHRVNTLADRQRYHNSILDELLARPVELHTEIEPDSGRLHDIEERLRILTTEHGDHLRNMNANHKFPPDPGPTDDSTESGHNVRAEESGSHSSHGDHSTNRLPRTESPHRSPLQSYPFARQRPDSDPATLLPMDTPQVPVHPIAPSAASITIHPVEPPPSLIPFIYRPARRPRSASTILVDDLQPYPSTNPPVSIPHASHRHRRQPTPPRPPPPAVQTEPPMAAYVHSEPDSEVERALLAIRRERLRRIDRAFSANPAPPRTLVQPSQERHLDPLPQERFQAGEAPRAITAVPPPIGHPLPEAERRSPPRQRRPEISAPLRFQGLPPELIPQGQSQPVPAPRHSPPLRRREPAHPMETGSSWYRPSPAHPRHAHRQTGPQTIVQVPSEIFQPVLDILQDIRQAQLETIAQQRAVVRETQVLNGWLEEELRRSIFDLAMISETTSPDRNNGQSLMTRTSVEAAEGGMSATYNALPASCPAARYLAGVFPKIRTYHLNVCRNSSKIQFPPDGRGLQCSIITLTTLPPPDTPPSSTYFPSPTSTPSPTPTTPPNLNTPTSYASDPDTHSLVPPPTPIIRTTTFHELPLDPPTQSASSPALRDAPTIIPSVSWHKYETTYSYPVQPTDTDSDPDSAGPMDDPNQSARNTASRPATGGSILTVVAVVGLAMVASVGHF